MILFVQTLQEHSNEILGFQWWLIAGLLAMLGILIGYVHKSNMGALTTLQNGQVELKKSIDSLKDDFNKELKDIDRRVSRIEGRLGLSNGKKVEQ